MANVTVEILFQIIGELVVESRLANKEIARLNEELQKDDTKKEQE